MGIIGCTSPAAPSKPTVIIAAPPSGSVYSVGEPVAVQSSAADAAGIVKVELLVDGLPVRVDQAPSQGQVQFVVIQTWTPTTPGSHTLTVRATNAQGEVGEAGIVISVNEKAAQAPTPLVTLPSLGTLAVPTLAPTPTETIPPLPTAVRLATATATEVPTTTPTTVVPTTTPTTVVPTTVVPTTAVPTTVVPTTVVPTTVPPTAVTCVLNSQYVADVTIPDGAQINPGANFTKTWRVRNNGTCTWDASYTIAFVSGSNLAGFTQNVIPPTAPGATADISIPMTAPVSHGTYYGVWRLRDANAQFFGTNLSVKINVGVPATASPTNTIPSPANTTMPPSSSGCSGTPNDFSFTVSPDTINAGQSATLSWGAITNASGAFLDGQGVATPGSRTVTPNQTTTFTLVARCGNNNRTRQVTLNVVGGAASASFAGKWNVRNSGAGNCTANFSVLGNKLSGTFCRKAQTFTQTGALQGTITQSGLTAEGTYNMDATNGTFIFILDGSGSRFRGSYLAFGSRLEFCGWRDGAAPPVPCFAQ